MADSGVTDRASRTRGDESLHSLSRSVRGVLRTAAVFQTGLEIGIPEIKNRLGELAFKDKAGVGALQAADLLAHVSYKRTGLDVGVNEELDMATVRLRPMTYKRIRLYDSISFPDRLLPKGSDGVRRHWADRGA